MSKFSVNEKNFFIANGKTFKKFTKEIEQSKIVHTDHSCVEKAVKNEIRRIRNSIDKNDGWKGLLNK